MDWIFLFLLPTPFIYCDPNPHCGDWTFGRWLCYEGGLLMLDSSTYEIPESSLVSSAMWGYRDKTAMYESGSGPHWKLDLITPSSWTSQPLEPWEIKVSLSYPAYVFVIVACIEYLFILYFPMFHHYSWYYCCSLALLSLEKGVQYQMGGILNQGAWQ